MDDFKSRLRNLFDLYDKQKTDPFGAIHDRFIAEMHCLIDYVSRLEKGKLLYEMICTVSDEVAKRRRCECDFDD